MDYEPPNGKIAVYYKALSSYDPKTIKTAADQLALSSDRFPPLETWRAICYKILHPSGHDEPLEPPDPKEEAIGKVMLPYYSMKITGDEAFNRLLAVYDQYGGEPSDYFKSLKGRGLFVFGCEMPEEE